RGDLDWVVMKAMETDRNRRYETASGLAMDVERFLAGEPVAARPPSAAYRLRKFARRHRASVAAAAAVVLAVLLGLGGTTWGLVRARREARTAKQAITFLVGMFEEADPTQDNASDRPPGSRPRGETLTAKEILERG